MLKVRTYVVIAAVIWLSSCAGPRVVPGSIEEEILNDARLCRKEYTAASDVRKDPVFGSGAPEISNDEALARLSQQLVLAELPAKRRNSLLNPLTGKPKQCVALSGGGQRAAAYAVGVLGAMQEQEQLSLRNVAYISAVSGGGYTLGWLVSNANGRDVNALFSPDGAAQRRLAELSPDGASSSLNIAANVLAFFGARVSPSYRKSGDSGKTVIEWPGRAQIDYGRALHDQFLSDPDNTFTAFGDSPKLSKLWESFQSSELPYPIWIATALPLESVELDPSGWGAVVERPLRKDGMCPMLRQGVFEMSLDKMGNTVYGYTRNDFESTFDRDFLSVTFPMTNSGAAFESPEINSRVLGAKLTAYSLDVPHAPAPSPIARQAEMPKSIWLTDGGRVENLGVYSLVLRGCEHITVVDAEHDPTLALNAYQNLKQNLLESLGLEFTVDGMEKQIGASAKACAASESRFRQTRWAWEQPSIPVSDDCFQADKTLQAYPIYRGEIRKKVPGKGGAISSVTYVKLALNPEKLFSERVGSDSYLDVVRKVYDRDRASPVEQGESKLSCGGAGLQYRCKFPQQATTHQALSTEDWNAYVGLGRLNYTRGVLSADFESRVHSGN